MNCPKCDFGLGADAVECPRCGVIIAKFLRAHERLAAELPAPPAAADATDDAIATATDLESRARTERTARAVALPLALFVAWLAVKGAPGAVRILTMWVHESGHAVTAWFCGYAAMPGPWFTPVGTERSPMLTVLLIGLLAFGGYRAWQLERRLWIAASGAGILLAFCGAVLLSTAAAQQLIIFGGDGGNFVLGTMLMLTVYARADHPICRQHLRWGFLAIGALAFMDVHAVWSGPIDQLPFGENENGLSDPSVLTEGYGWTPQTLVTHYGQLANACFAVLLVVYVAVLYAQTVNGGSGSDRGQTTLRDQTNKVV